MELLLAIWLVIELAGRLYWRWEKWRLENTGSRDWGPGVDGEGE